MPKRLEADRSSPIPLPVQGLQGDRPASPPPAQGDSASSKSSPAFSSHLPKGKAKAKQLRAQYQEENREKAKIWVDRLRREGHIPLMLLCNRVVTAKNVKQRAKLSRFPG